MVIMPIVSEVGFQDCKERSTCSKPSFGEHPQPLSALARFAASPALRGLAIPR
jgi:hypothetical protein